MQMTCLGTLLDYLCKRIYVYSYYAACMLNSEWCTLYVGAIIEGPSNITYLPGLTPLPIELTCNVTGVAAWRVNGTDFFPASLANGNLPGHSVAGSNIWVNSPENNTEYICASVIGANVTLSDPAYIIIAGEQYAHTYVCMQAHAGLKRV